MEEKILYNEKQLLDRVAAGSEEAYRELFDKYWNGIFELGLKMTKSPEQAKDMAQDVFARLWVHRTQLPLLGSFEGFLYTVARNIVRDFLKKRVFDPANDGYMLQYLNLQPLGPEERLDSMEKQQILEDAIKKLPPQIQRAFRLRYQDFSHDEIAKAMNISRVTSKSYVVRALELLRGYMSDHPDIFLLLLVLYYPSQGV